MELKKTKIYNKFCIAFSVFSVLTCVAAYVATMFGIGYKQTEGDFGEGIALAIGIVFFAILMIGIAVLVVLTVAERIIVYKIKNNIKRMLYFEIAGLVIKIVFAVGVVFVNVMIFACGLWLLGGVNTAIALFLIITIVLNICSVSEIKSVRGGHENNNIVEE